MTSSAPSQGPQGTHADDASATSLTSLTSWAPALAVSLVLAAGGAWFALAAALGAGEDVSADENRALARWPAFSSAELASGRYTRDLDLWVADHFPARRALLAVAARLKDARGFATDDEVFDGAALGAFGLDGAIDGADGVEGAANDAGIVTDDAVVNAGPVDAGAADAGAADAGPADAGAADAGPADADDVDAGADDVVDAGPAQKKRYTSGITVTGDRGLMYLVGDDDTARAFGASVNAWRQALPASVALTLLVTPTSTHYYLPDDQQDRSLPQRHNLDVLRASLAPGIGWVDVDAALRPHVDEDIFFRTDHHWTARGAFYAYAAWAEAQGFKPVALDSLEKKSHPSVLGSLHRVTQAKALREHPEAVDYWLPSVEYLAQRWRSLDEAPRAARFIVEREKNYATFLGGDDPLLVATTQAATNEPERHLLLVKNSYGNALAPFLLHHFSQVVVVDYRYYAGSVLGLVKKYAITDVLLQNATVTMNSRPHARRLREVLSGKGAAWDAVTPESQAAEQKKRAGQGAAGGAPADAGVDASSSSPAGAAAAGGGP
jgi:hypothetical protein